MWNTITTVTVCIPLIIMTACAPSLQYRLGQGFYSSTFVKSQVQAAANNNKITNVGRFSTDAGGCGNYPQDATDQNIVIPAIKAKLREVGANVAENVVANGRWFDVVTEVFIIPALLACTNWTISGEALFIEWDPRSALTGVTTLSAASDTPMVIVLKS